MADDPHKLFEAWLAEARVGEPYDPEAMALATADADGRPSVRMVLLKGHDRRGFAFYTNEGSRKGTDLAANPGAALSPLKSLRRQVRAGPVDPSSDAEPTPISPPPAMRDRAWVRTIPPLAPRYFEARYRRLAMSMRARRDRPLIGGHRLFGASNSGGSAAPAPHRRLS